MRFYPRSITYTASFLEQQGLLPDALVKLQGSGVFDHGGVLIRQLEDKVAPGGVFGDEIFVDCKAYLKAVVSSEPVLLAMTTKAAYQKGIEAAIEVEAEKRLGTVMTRVFHDCLPMAISKKIVVAMLRNEVTLDKGQSVPTRNARMFCLYSGSIAVRKKIGSEAERLEQGKPKPEERPEGRKLISKREKIREVSSRLPAVKQQYFDLPVELRLDQRFKNMMLRKKQNPAGYETLLNLQGGEIFGLFELIGGHPFDYEILAHERSTIMSISGDAVADFIEGSAYFKRFVKVHLRERRQGNNLARQQKTRLYDFHEKQALHRDQLAKELRYNDPNNPETKEAVDKARKELNALVGHRKPENVDIFLSHNKHFWDQLDQDHGAMVEEFNKLFQKPDKRLRFKLMRENAIPIPSQSKANNSSLISGRSSSANSKGKLQLGPSINFTLADEVEVSFCKTSEYPSVISNKESTLVSKLYQLSRGPGGKNLAEYIASRVTRTSSQSQERHHASRSYDQSSKNRKKQIFETVVERSTSVDQDASILIKPVSAKVVTRYLKHVLPKQPRAKYDPRFQPRSQTSKPKVRFEIPLN